MLATAVKLCLLAQFRTPLSRGEQLAHRSQSHCGWAPRARPRRRIHLRQLRAVLRPPPIRCEEIVAAYGHACDDTASLTDNTHRQASRRHFQAIERRDGRGVLPRWEGSDKQYKKARNSPRWAFKTSGVDGAISTGTTHIKHHEGRVAWLHCCGEYAGRHRNLDFYLAQCARPPCTPRSVAWKCITGNHAPFAPRRRIASPKLVEETTSMLTARAGGGGSEPARESEMLPAHRGSAPG